MEQPFTEEYLRTIYNPKDDFDDVENPFDTAHIFLMGSCNIFSYALSKEFGYACKQLYSKSNSCIHCFCEYNCGDQKYYIDVRGVFIAQNKLLARFLKYERTQYFIKKQDSISDGMKENYFQKGLAFAEYIIKTYHKHYEIEDLSHGEQ